MFRLVEFKTWSEDVDRDGKPVAINPDDVASVQHMSLKRGYGGYSTLSEIRLRNGDKIRVASEYHKTVEMLQAPIPDRELAEDISDGYLSE